MIWSFSGKPFFLEGLGEAITDFDSAFSLPNAPPRCHLDATRMFQKNQFLFCFALGLLYLCISNSICDMDNKTLVARLATKLGKSKTDVSRLVEAFVGVVATRCAEMDSVSIPGFGTLEPVKHDEEIRVNPATGQRTLYPPKVEMSFQPSTILKNKLNNKPPIVS